VPLIFNSEEVLKNCLKNTIPKKGEKFSNNVINQLLPEFNYANLLEYIEKSVNINDENYSS
jgi:hypothetical protein